MAMANFGRMPIWVRVTLRGLLGAARRRRACRRHRRRHFPRYPLVTFDEGQGLRILQ